MKSSPSAPKVAAIFLSALLPTVASSAASAQVGGGVRAKSLYEKVSPSLVAVQYVFDAEQRRTEISGVGVVVGDGGLVMVPMGVIPPFPDEQIKEFKVIIPKLDADHEELDAVFLGRNEVAAVAFFKLKEPKNLPKMTFVDKKPDVGDALYSIGMFPKEAGYRTYVTSGTVAAFFRGETPAWMFAGPLVNVGGVVFNSGGEAIGYVFPQGAAPIFLSPRGQQAGDTTYFVPTSEFAYAIATPPIEGKPAPFPFTGIFGMKGLTKDLAEVYGLVGKPAVEIGDVIPGSPAEKGGLLKGMIVTEVDGKPIERADEPEELGGIVAKSIAKHKVGDVVTFTTIAKKGEPPKPIQVTLGEHPAQPNTAKRFFAEDMGFTVRESVFGDLYGRKLPLDTKGLVLDYVKEGSQAQSARLGRGDFVTQINGVAVTDLPTFKSTYEGLRKDKPREAIVLQVVRQGNTQIIRIEPPQ